MNLVADVNEETGTELVESTSPDSVEKREIIIGREARSGVITKPCDKLFTDVPVIYGVFRTSKIPTTAIKYSIVWTCVKGYKTPNHVLLNMPKEYDPSKEKKRKDPELKKDFMIIFDLRNQTRKLPPGEYKVEIFIDEVSQSEKKFTLEKRQGLYLGKKLGKTGVDDPMDKFDGHTLVVFGMYHFKEIQKSENINEEIGLIKWARLVKDSEKEELVQETPITTKQVGMGYDCFKFHIAKPPKGFEPGKYTCSVIVKSDLVAKKEFDILPPKPRLFLGTLLTRHGDIIDDSFVFPGGIKMLKGVYKFCKEITSKKVGKIKWWLVKANKLKEPVVIGQSVIEGDKDYNYIAFQMDFTKAPQTIPGQYKCEVFLDEEMIAERHFLIQPTYAILLGKVENNNVPKPSAVFVEGVKEISGMLRTNHQFAPGTFVTTFWFAARAMGIAQNTLIFNSKKVMEKGFRHLLISCKLPGAFPQGKYICVIGINKQLVAAKEFTVETVQSVLARMNAPNMQGARPQNLARGMQMYPGMGQQGNVNKDVFNDKFGDI